jgi:hypothetical protein
LVFGYIVDMIPHSDPQIGSGGVFCYLSESVDAVGHVARVRKEVVAVICQLRWK